MTLVICVSKLHPKLRHVEKWQKTVCHPTLDTQKCWARHIHLMSSQLLKLSLHLTDHLMPAFCWSNISPHWYNTSTARQGSATSCMTNDMPARCQSPPAQANSPTSGQSMLLSYTVDPVCSDATDWNTHVTRVQRNIHTRTRCIQARLQGKTRHRGTNKGEQRNRNTSRGRKERWGKGRRKKDRKRLEELTEKLTG